MKKLFISLFLFSFFIVGSQAYAVSSLESSSNIVGGVDSYGCIPSAGYSWCATKNKCLRSWEEKCEISNINNPSIFGVSGPQTLSINQTGTWKVEASNQNGGNLFYSVNWGDEKYHILPMNLLAPSFDVPQQSATFTHSYSQAGLYQPVFTVTSENTIKCITNPCPSNGGSTKTSLTVKVLDTEIICPVGCNCVGNTKSCPIDPPDDGCLPGYNYNTTTGQMCTGVIIEDGCLPSYKYNPITGKLCVHTVTDPLPTPDLSKTIMPIKRILKKGTKGDDVKRLQSFFHLVEDGLFGSETKKKVMEWQAENGLKVDGLFGSESIQKAGLDN